MPTSDTHNTKPNQHLSLYKREGVDVTRRQNTTKAAYLEPNSQSMQKPVEGLPASALFTTKSMLKNVEGKGLEKTIGTYTKEGYSHHTAPVSNTTKPTKQCVSLIEQCTIGF